MEKGDLIFCLLLIGIPLLNWARLSFLYSKKLNKTIAQSKRISAEKVEKSILYFSKRAKFFDQRINKSNESRKENKGELIYWEKEYQKSIGKFSNEDWKELEWREKWDCFYIKQDIDREINLRKIFSPD